MRVLVVEDSPTLRHLLRGLLSSAPGVQVVGEAASGEEAVEAAVRLRPDVVSLDVFLPGLSAAEVVRRLLLSHPVPVVLVSDAPRDAAEVFAALEAGALDFVVKPRAGDEAQARWLVETLRVLSRVKVRRRRSPPPLEGRVRPARVVAIGSSAGGPAALRVLLEALPAQLRVPVLVAQHIAAGFEGGLVEWLQARCRLPVRLAQDGRPLAAGEVIVGRPGTDLGVGPSRTASVKPAGERGYHPSVDLLFSSVASAYGAGSLAVVLSGTGADGRQGAAEMVAAGGAVMAQDEHSAAVDGMPRAVREAGLATVVGEPVALAAALLRRCQGRLDSVDVGEKA
jgi:two-component system chemotaxis response regulator CheB